MALIFLSNIFSGTDLMVKPDCETSQSEDCICYGGKVKLDCDVQIEPECTRFKCEVPECLIETDCNDQQHISCLGQWQCIDYSCNWKCSGG